MGCQELSWLWTAEPCCSCSQCNHSFTQWVPAVIRALKAPQIYGNPVSSGKKPEENERCSTTCPSIYITYRPSLQTQMSWLLSQPPQLRVPKWTQPRPTVEGQAHQEPRNSVASPE